MGDPITNIAGAVGRQIERGIGDVGTGLHAAANAVGTVLKTLGGGDRVYSVHARGSENHAGDQLQTMNHQGVSHAPNAGPAMQNHINTPPRPYHTDAVNVDGKTQMQTRDTRTGQVIAGSKGGLRSELVTGGDGKPQIQTRDTKTGGVVGGYGYGALK